MRNRFSEDLGYTGGLASIYLCSLTHSQGPPFLFATHYFPSLSHYFLILGQRDKKMMSLIKFIEWLAVAPLTSRGYILEGQKNSLKRYTDISTIIKQPETISGPIISFTVRENHIGLALSEVFCYRQKKLTTLFNRTKS